MSPSSLLCGVAFWHNVLLSHSSKLETCGEDGITAPEDDTVSLLQDVKKVKFQHAIQSVNKHDHGKGGCSTQCKKGCAKACKVTSETVPEFKECKKGCQTCENFNCGEMTLKLLDTTKCLDGTNAGYYADIKDDSDVWVIWMEGGGACSDKADCKRRSKTDLGSSKKWTPTRLTGKGVLYPDCGLNPEFCQANRIYIKYCSGDSHQGQRTNKYQGFFMSGHLNFKAIIKDLLETTSIGTASRVLLTGSSAGGVGTVVNADSLTDMLQDVIVKAAPISGWFLPDKAEDGGLAVSLYPDWLNNDVTKDKFFETAWETKLDWSKAYQGNCPTEEGLKCGNMPTRADYVKTPMFIAQNMWDSFQLGKVYEILKYFPGKDKSTWSTKQKEWMTYYARAAQASTKKIAEKPGNGLFLPGTVRHGGDIGLTRKTAVIQDHNYYEVLADWFYDVDQFLPHVLTDACDDVETCLAYLPGR